MTRSRPSIVAPVLLAGLALTVFALSRCSSTSGTGDSGTPPDSGSTTQDSGTFQDSGTPADSGNTTQDSGPGQTDAGPTDSGSTVQDSGTSCTGTQIACDGGCLPAGSCCGDATCAGAGANYVCLPDGQCTAPACSGTVHNCTTFTDLTGSGTPTINFGGGLGLVYSPNCAQIKVGQSVTFQGAFTSHPLFETCGPALAISQTQTGNTATFAFSDAGLYGYWCEVHGPGSGMAGAIKVIP